MYDLNHLYLFFQCLCQLHRLPRAYSSVMTTLIADKHGKRRVSVREFDLELPLPLNVSKFGKRGFRIYVGASVSKKYVKRVHMYEE